MNTSEAKHLKVLVMRNGEAKVNLTFPIYTLNILESIMPELVLEKLKSKGIDLGPMIQKIKSKGLTPQVVFEHIETDSSYKVWIE
jgi:hypothetical protein